MRTLAFPLFLSLPLLASAQQPTVALERQPSGVEVVRTPLPPQSPATPAPPLTTSDAAPPPLEVDERPLWKLFHDGRFTELQAEIEHLKRENPGWQPPAELRELPRHQPADRAGDQEPSGQAIGEAWQAFDRGDLQTAESRFQAIRRQQPGHVDARYGLALIRFRQQWLAEADALLSGTTGPKERALLADIRLARARAANRAAQYQQSNAWLAQAETLGAKGREVLLLRAWNDLGLKQWNSAAEVFLQAYRQHPSQDAAEGLTLALTRSGQWERLEGLALKWGGPLEEKARHAQAQRLADRGLDLAAYALALDRDTDLQNLDSPWLGGFGGVRDKGGKEGTSRLTLERSPILQGEWRRQSDRFGLSLTRIHLDSGTADPSTQLGSHNPATPWRFTPLSGLDAGIEPRFWWRREGWTSLYGELGTTPLDGPLAANPTGKLGLLQQTERGNRRAELFLEPVRESMLSYVGAIDPYTGKVWGQVGKLGLGLSAYEGWGNGWGISGGVEAAGYQGTEVADNKSLSLTAAVSRDLKLPGFDYFTLGPEASLQGYERNLSQFTLGHGGYFSPQRRTALGLAANFQAKQPHFALKGRLYAGRTSHFQEAAPCFPLGTPVGGACNQDYAAVEESGKELGARISAVFRLSDRTQLLLGAAASRAPEYEETTLFAGLRISLEPRKGISLSDLPEE